MESLTFTFTFSSMNLAQKRAVDFSKGSLGSRGFSCHVSSMYSRMTRDSATGFPLCTSTGIFLWTGLYWRRMGLLFVKSSSIYSYSTPLSFSAHSILQQKRLSDAHHFHFSHSEFYRIWNQTRAFHQWNYYFGIFGCGILEIFVFLRESQQPSETGLVFQNFGCGILTYFLYYKYILEENFPSLYLQHLIQSIDKIFIVIYIGFTIQVSWIMAYVIS